MSVLLNQKPKCHTGWRELLMHQQSRQVIRHVFPFAIKETHVGNLHISLLLGQFQVPPNCAEYSMAPLPHHLPQIPPSNLHPNLKAPVLLQEGGHCCCHLYQSSPSFIIRLTHFLSIFLIGNHSFSDLIYCFLHVMGRSNALLRKAQSKGFPHCNDLFWCRIDTTTSQTIVACPGMIASRSTGACSTWHSLESYSTMQCGGRIVKPKYPSHNGKLSCCDDPLLAFQQYTFGESDSGTCFQAHFVVR
jgi:hypothetical protein